jgi:hypothetical protein
MAAAVCSQSLTVAQKYPKHTSSKEDALEISERRPDLAIEYTKVSKVKVGSRKKSYRRGEMISLDVALLNTSNIPVFFHKFFQPNFYVQGLHGKPVLLGFYVVVEAPTTLDSYVLLQPGEMMVKSFEVLAGCDKRASENMASGLNEKDSRRQFEGNRFVNWGDSCLRISRPGSYNIRVEQGNNEVVVLATTTNAKTAVGPARSDVFTIQIVK